jgi:hypothetical protein
MSCYPASRNSGARLAPPLRDLRVEAIEREHLRARLSDEGCEVVKATMQAMQQGMSPVITVNGSLLELRFHFADCLPSRSADGIEASV